MLHFFCFQVSVIAFTLFLFVVSENTFIAFHSLYTELGIDVFLTVHHELAIY